MSKDIFISYSRRDQEFVSRLAADLNEQVAGVWFDQSALQVGQNWHDAILDGIRDCKAFVVVLSPDAIESRYVHEEVETALRLGKPIFPIIYRSSRWTGEFESLTRDIQNINLHSGSYTDNFHKLVDGLVEAGAIKPADERPFLREPAKISAGVVIRKALSWALAWSLGWLIFWSITFLFLFIFIVIQNKAGWEDILNFLTFCLSGMAGGFIGGLIAGTWSMLVLRPYAPSIYWRHMVPTIRIWAICGPLGMIISGVTTIVMLILGVISTRNEIPTCPAGNIAECLGQIFYSAYAEEATTIALITGVFFLLVVWVWHAIGTLAGWLVVRHVRRLEPAITTMQGWGVAIGWGFGSIMAAIVTALTISIMADILNLWALQLSF